MNRFEPLKFSKFVKSLRITISVFFYASIVFLAILLVGAIFCVTAPDKFFHLSNFRTGSFSFELNGMIQYNLHAANLPGDLSLRKIFIGIVGSAFLYGLVLLNVFKQLKGILSSTEKKQPFHKDNGTRLTNMAGCIIGAAFLFPALGELVSLRIINTFGLMNLSVRYSPDLLLVLTGFLLLFLAVVFNYGCYLQNEYDETI